MYYIIKRAGRYYFNRRVPVEYTDYDPRGTVRETLKTRDAQKALKLAIVRNETLEAYWKNLSQEGIKHSETKYKAAIARAKTLGFAYFPSSTLAEMPFDEIGKRLVHIEQHLFNLHHVEAVIGGIAAPVIMLDDVVARYWEYSKDQILGKSSKQVRKWKNPRIKAMRNFINCVGNKAMHQLTREEALIFKDWWIGRIDNEGLTSNSANKDFMHVKVMITCVAENLKIALDTSRIFNKIRIDLDDAGKRLPFDNDYLTGTLLHPDNLCTLNDQARNALYAFSETGVGPTELVGVLPEDIFLYEQVPYIHIKRRKGNLLKTKFRDRKIPLVGFALQAFRAFPQGFTEYRDRADALSNCLNKYLRENQLLPSEEHSLYSLRHSFQDRLLAANAPDRVQADLMGHKFSRPTYGDGASLKQKQDWLFKIQLKKL